ncbi:MAG: hypothetical protein K9G46_07020 [Flavobacteriales bacterium]|nr:hypothetical protein [Flavobacteriales bacterium]
MYKKAFIPFPEVLPAKLSLADARFAIEKVANELLAKKTSFTSVTVAAGPAGEKPAFVITFDFQRDPIDGPIITKVKIRYAKDGEVLTTDKLPKLKIVEFPEVVAEAKPKAAAPKAAKATAAPKSETATAADLAGPLESDGPAPDATQGTEGSDSGE